MSQIQLEKVLGGIQNSLTTLGEKMLVIEGGVIGLEKSVVRLEERMTGVEAKMTGVEDGITGMEKKMTGFEEGMSFVRENMVTKKYAEHFATKDELAAVNSNIISHIDDFVGMHQRTDLELVALRAKSDRLESHIQQLARHTKLALE